MEKLLATCWVLNIPAKHLKKVLRLPVVMTNGTLPMDFYNALSTPELLDPEYCWLTTKGRVLTQEEAAVFANETGLLDKKVKKLTKEIFESC